MDAGSLAVVGTGWRAGNWLAAADSANITLAELAETARHRLAQLDQADDHSQGTGSTPTPADAL